MEPAELYMTFDGVETLARELDQNLLQGRAFLLIAPAGDVAVPALLSTCNLVLVHPALDRQLTVGAQVVMVNGAESPMLSVGLQLRPFGAAVVADLEAFARAAPQPLAPSEPAGAQNAEKDPHDDTHEDKGDDEAHYCDHQETPRPVQLRRLSYAQQQKLARTGILSDRVTLERLYGPSVWKSLLDNPKLTIPEVARIARKGTVPRPLIETILEHNAWIQASTVRRALMGNPKVAPEGIVKLLRITPKHELRTIHRGTAYSPFVREQARKLLG